MKKGKSVLAELTQDKEYAIMKKDLPTLAPIVSSLLITHCLAPMLTGILKRYGELCKDNAY